MTTAFAATLLASCATRPEGREPVPPWQAPASGEVARLITRGAVAPGDAYLVFVLDDGEHCRRPQLVGTGNAVQHPVATTLPAGQPVTLEFELVKPARQVCSMRWTFTPGTNKAYLLAGSTVPGGCGAFVEDVTDVDHPKREESALRRNQPQAHCLPIAESHPVAVAAAASAASGADAVLNERATSTDLEGLIAP